MRIRRILFWGLLVLIVLAGTIAIAAYQALGTFSVEIPEALKGDKPGALVAVQRTGSYPRFVVQYLLDSANLPDRIDVTFGITLYRVQYRTTNHDGSLVVASGLVSLPTRSPLNSAVMYLHGTTTQRRAAPSQPGLGEGTLVAAAASGMGHVLVAPDYIGLGESRAVHPYLHAKTTASTSIDLLHAARALVEHLRGQWPAPLYITGFSQGGHATFAVQRELERLNDPHFMVKASAPVAGPFHLREISLPNALTGKSEAHALYLAYLASAYAPIYGRSLKTLLVPPYVERVPVLFDGEHEPETISAALPKHPRDMFTPEFLEAYDHGTSHWFLDAITENSVSDWTPRARVRVYYGDGDLDVLPEEARRAEAEMNHRGASVKALSVGRYHHAESAYRAIPQALRWFTELASEEP